MPDATSPSHARDEQVLAMCVGLLELHAAITQSTTPATALRQALLDKGINHYDSVTANLGEYGYVYVDPATGRFRPGPRLLALLHLLQDPAAGEGDDTRKPQGWATDRPIMFPPSFGPPHRQPPRDDGNVSEGGVTMSDGTHHGSRTDLGPQACKIQELLQDNGYKVYASKAGRLVVCTGTNPRLDRSAVGTDDQGDDHRAMSRLAQSLRIALPEELQPGADLRS